MNQTASSRRCHPRSSNDIWVHTSLWRVSAVMGGPPRKIRRRNLWIYPMKRECAFKGILKDLRGGGATFFYLNWLVLRWLFWPVSCLLCLVSWPWPPIPLKPSLLLSLYYWFELFTSMMMEMSSFRQAPPWPPPLLLFIPACLCSKCTYSFEGSNGVEDGHARNSPHMQRRKEKQTFVLPTMLRRHVVFWYGKKSDILKIFFFPLWF